MSGTVTIPRAVFLDVEGVRARRARLVGRAFGVVVAAYLFLSVAAILGAPWVPRVALPGVGPVVPDPGPTLQPALGPAAVATPPAGSAGPPERTPPSPGRAGTDAGSSTAPAATPTPGRAPGAPATGAPAAATPPSPPAPAVSDGRPGQAPFPPPGRGRPSTTTTPGAAGIRGRR